MKEEYFHRVTKLSPTRLWINNPTPNVIDELLEKIPDFRRAYLEDGLTIEEFKDFGPVDFFRSMFVKGWDYLLNTIKERCTEAT